MNLLYVLVVWHTMGWVKSYDLAGPWSSRQACERAGYQRATQFRSYRPGFQCVEVKTVEGNTEKRE
jgi:hypothetical protein